MPAAGMPSSPARGADAGRPIAQYGRPGAPTMKDTSAAAAQHRELQQWEQHRDKRMQLQQQHQQEQKMLLHRRQEQEALQQLQERQQVSPIAPRSSTPTGRANLRARSAAAGLAQRPDAQSSSDHGVHADQRPFRPLRASGTGASAEQRSKSTSHARERHPASRHRAWRVEKPNLEVARRARSATNMGSLARAIVEGGCTRLRAGAGDFKGLNEAVRTTFGDEFPSEFFGFICDRALDYDMLFPHGIYYVTEEAATEAERRLEWTQGQCLCILCNAFLCAWQQRTSRNCRCLERVGPFEIPSINFDEMYVSSGNYKAQVAKIHMFFCYIRKQQKRFCAGDELTRALIFIRAKTSLVPDWGSSRKPLCDVTMRKLRESIDDAKDMLRADFANEMVGGGSLAYGCVQEEIMFACHPELNCARLVFTPMLEDEAFILCGAEQFAEPGGYAMGLSCNGPYEDRSGEVDIGHGRRRLNTAIAAIDAVDYRGADSQVQFSADCVRRELLKAYTGFNVPADLNTPQTLATGNWGAGAFQGDAALKALVQWLAASEAGLDVCYFPFDNQQLATELPRVVQAAQNLRWTVSDLGNFLLRQLPSSCRGGAVPVLPQLQHALRSVKAI